MSGGRAFGYLRLRFVVIGEQAEVVLEPSLKAAAVRQCAAHDDAAAVDAVAPQTRWNLRRRIAFVSDAHRARRSDHQRGLALSHASGPDIVRGPVPYRGEPFGTREPRPARCEFFIEAEGLRIGRHDGREILGFQFQELK